MENQTEVKFVGGYTTIQLLNLKILTETECEIWDEKQFSLALFSMIEEEERIMKNVNWASTMAKQVRTF